MTAGRRYAEAAFQIASRDGSTGEWQRRLDRLAEILRDERLDRLAANPAIPQEVREKVLREALGWSAGEPAFNLVRLLVRRGRTRLAPVIAGEFRRLVLRDSGILEATLATATELSREEEDAIRRRLEQMTGRRVELRVTVDGGLIGGVAVRIGDRMIDASVRGRLERLRDRLAAGAAG